MKYDEEKEAPNQGKHGSHIEVLEPDWLREQVIGEMRAGLEKYGVLGAVWGREGATLMRQNAQDIMCTLQNDLFRKVLKMLSQLIRNLARD